LGNGCGDYFMGGILKEMLEAKDGDCDLLNKGKNRKKELV